MVYTSIETTLAILPLSDEDYIIECLGQKGLLELECTSHSTRLALQRSDVYWRMRYERRFHWLYVDNEHTRNRHGVREAFYGLCWRIAYERRMEVESNFRNGHFETKHYTLPRTMCNGLGRHKELSASGVFRQVSGEELSSVGFAFIRPHETAEGKTILDGSIIPLANSFISKNAFPESVFSAKETDTVLDTGHYTIICVAGAIVAKPTYLNNNWAILYTKQAINTPSVLSTHGRWILFAEPNGKKTRYVLGNMETARQIELKHGGPTPVFIETADDNSATVYTRGRHRIGQKFRWALLQYTVSGMNSRAIVHNSSFKTITDVEVNWAGQLGPGYAQYHCKEVFGITPMILIHSTQTPQKQKAMYFIRARAAFRLTCQSAIISYTSHCDILDLLTGETIQSVRYPSGVEDIRPILGSCWYYDRHLDGRTLVDICTGKLIKTPDAIKDVAAVYFNAAPTFLWICKNFESTVEMLDYTLPSVGYSAPLPLISE
ncbi:hypothetical protein BDF19DRAFT_438252 [Syncephalis fuscata]|nr:hypothetical protein BDF19DRAFT_438252 [Syncephalis fuscata]